MRTVPAPSAFAARERSGVAYAVSAYGLWGLFPLYFLLLLPSGPFEIVAYRVLFSFVFCLVVITVLRRWDKIFADRAADQALPDAGRRRDARSSSTGRCTCWPCWPDTSPRPRSATSSTRSSPCCSACCCCGRSSGPRSGPRSALSGVAVLVLAINYGAFPWIALALAFSFGLYGYAKKSVGGKVDALTGLTIETGWLVPVAVGRAGVRGR